MTRIYLSKAFLLLIFHQLYIGNISKKIILIFLTSLLIAFTILIIYLIKPETDNTDFLFAFTSHYVEIAKKQRLGIVLTMLPNFFESDFLRILFGFTSDQDILMERFREINDKPLLLNKNARLIEDVYWVALLYYYGVLGLSVFLIFLRGIWNKMKSGIKSIGDFNQTPISLAALLLLFASLLLNIFNQAFEVRTFSFFLWLIIGLGALEVRNIQITTRTRANE